MINRLFITVILVLFSVTPTLGKDNIVADLDQDQVQITTGFNGADLLLFGAVNRAAVDDIAIIVKGPPKTIAIRHKEKVAGIWLNTGSVNAIGLPSFYHVLSTRPLEEIASPSTLKVNRLNLDNIAFRLDKESTLAASDRAEWKQALIRNMKDGGLWRATSGQISVRDGLLFRANIELPANIIPGDYEIQVLQFRDNAVIEETVSTIAVVKTGLSAKVYKFAHEQSALYGIFAIVFAVAAGWLAAVAFRK